LLQNNIKTRIEAANLRKHGI